MALHIIYFFILLTYGIWILSIILKNPILALFSCLLMFSLSIYIFVNGMDIFNQNNLLSMTLAAITFAIAGMTTYQAGYELYNGGE